VQAERVPFRRNQIVGATGFGGFALIGLAMAISPAGGPENNSPRFGAVLALVSVAISVHVFRSSWVEVHGSEIVVALPFRRAIRVPLSGVAAAISVRRIVGLLPRRSLALQLADGRVRVFDVLNQRPSEAFERIGPVGRAASMINEAIHRSSSAGPA
jgi:hypothetical protein